jgi:hypothetical protein
MSKNIHWLFTIIFSIMIVSCVDLNNAESNIPLENVGSNDDNSDSDEIEDEEEEEEEYTSSNNTIVPEYSNFNQNIIWENVFTEGPPGKVNRAVVDSNGDAAVVFMPDNQTRVLKIDGVTGEKVWSKSFDNTAGFGINEIVDGNTIDYIISGGKGETQERWVARISGVDGSEIWNKTYSYDGDRDQYDAVRMTIVGSDNYIYGSGFVQGGDKETIFMVYDGKAMIIKIDPSDGSEIWTEVNPSSEYALAVVESSSGDLFYGGFNSRRDLLTLSKLEKNGEEIWTEMLENTDRIIPYDMTIDSSDIIYYGGHTGRQGAGDPFDYTCIKLDTDAKISWIKHYGNPRGYDMEYIRSELYGVKVNSFGIFLFGGTGDESGSFSETSPTYLSSDIWNGWVLIIDPEGNILQSDVFCQENVNTATEYGCLTEDGYMIFNDTDAFGDTEVGVIKVKL